jgi:hypothetical protein
MAPKYGVEPAAQYTGDTNEKYIHEKTGEPKYILSPLDEETPGDGVLPESRHILSGDTRQDIKDMFRLGKKQEFKRNFSLISTLGFISMYVFPHPFCERLFDWLKCSCNLLTLLSQIHGYLGICPGLSERGPIRRRVCWTVLDFHCHSHAIFDRCCEPG